MHKDIYEAIDDLVSIAKELSDDNQTTLEVFINCEGVQVKSNYRTPEQLKSSGVSMRNLKGEFIK